MKNRSKIALMVVMIILLLLVFVYQNLQFQNGKLHIVFCNVGQGDAIFIRTPKGDDVLVDGGPSNQVLDCISKHMPFWDKTIELVILTHPHSDHFIGLISVLNRYTVKQFVTEDLSNNTVAYKALKNLIQQTNTSFRLVHTGDQFKSKDGFLIKILGPTDEFLKQSSPNGQIGESKEFGSVLTFVSYKGFSLLLTGDSQKEELKDAILRYNISNIDIFQEPHHGSKTGIDKEIVETLSPKLVVISVGAHNKYHHPSEEVLDLLKLNKIKMFRTDKNGEISFESNGEGFTVSKIRS